MQTKFDNGDVSFLSTRNWALFTLLITEKAKVATALKCRFADLNLSEGTLATERKAITLSIITLDTLKSYIAQFAHVFSPNGPLFPSRNERFIPAQTFRYKILRPAIKKIDPNYEPHVFHPAKLPPHIRTFLLRDPNQVEPLNLQDALIFKLTLWLGLRPSEFGPIQKCDVNFAEKSIMLHSTKSRAEDYVPLPPPMEGELRAFIKDLQPDEFLFKDTRNKPVQRKYVSTIVTQWSQMHGLQDIHPRLIRRSLANYLEDQGASKIEVESLLRHVGSSTFRRYYSRENLDRAHAALKFHYLYRHAN